MYTRSDPEDALAVWYDTSETVIDRHTLVQQMKVKTTKTCPWLIPELIRGSVDDSKSMTMQRPHGSEDESWGLIGYTPKLASQQHYWVDSDLESTGEEKKRTTQAHMAQRHLGKNTKKRSLLNGAGEDSPKPGALAEA